MTMHDQRAKKTRRRSIRRSRLAAALCGSLLTLSGCGIPALRCPQPGPALPQGYNWNNGARYWGADVEPGLIGSSGISTGPTTAPLAAVGSVRLAGGNVEHHADPAANVAQAGIPTGPAAQSDAAGGGDGLMGFFKAAYRPKQTQEEPWDQEEPWEEPDEAVGVAPEVTPE